MKNTLKSIWVNCQSVVYTILTIVGLVLILAGGLLALPIVIVLIIGAVIFIAYKVGIDETDEPYDMNNMYRSNKRYKDDD
jgi:hypothetical protein|tara:strand:- start:4011 stop:4250 length:240 start_codon:yes stop_codon:yes gene_type:complete